MKRIFASVAFAAACLVVAVAHAATLSNEDQTYANVELVLGEGDAYADVIELQPSETVGDVCLDGCILRLENGNELPVTGDEIVIIRDGAFIIVQ